jgi:hypothetical protein
LVKALLLATGLSKLQDMYSLGRERMLLTSGRSPWSRETPSLSGALLAWLSPWADLMKL